MFMDLNIPRLNAETLGLVEFRDGTTVNLVHVEHHEGAQRAIGQADIALQMISEARSRLGAYQNRLEATVRNLDNTSVHTQSARSRIMDTDMAREMTTFSKRNIMYQAGLAILGQANQRPQQILSLLQ
jgi:flagellin